MDYLNYNNKLIEQRLDHRYYVVYTASGTNVASAVVDTHKLPDFRFEEACIPPSGFVSDVKTFYFSTNNEEEADYLCSILNSAVLNDKIKSIQTRGKFGPRDIHRRPFEFGIPRFNPNSETHKQIAALGKKAAKDAVRLPKTSRLKMKAVIPSMKEIDKLVSQLLNA